MHIAVVDDDETVADFVSQALGDGDYRLSRFRNGRDTLIALQRERFDLLIVDWNMPRLSGLELVETIRTQLSERPPIVMLTNRADKDDIARALNAGADDYIVKPETPAVFSARVRALLRRAAPAAPVEAGPLQFGTYVFDRQRSTAVRDGQEIAITAKEFALALLFFTNRDRPLSRAYIMETVWKSTAELSTRTLDMHVSRIRSKLSLRPENGFSLRTVFGYGYRLESCQPGSVGDAEG